MRELLFDLILVSKLFMSVMSDREHTSGRMLGETCSPKRTCVCRVFRSVYVVLDVYSEHSLSAGKKLYRAREGLGGDGGGGVRRVEGRGMAVAGV